MLTFSVAAVMAIACSASYTPIWFTRAVFTVALELRRYDTLVRIHDILCKIRCKIKHHRTGIMQVTRKTHYQQMQTILRHCAGQYEIRL